MCSKYGWEITFAELHARDDVARAAGTSEEAVNCSCLHISLAMPTPVYLP